MADGLFDNLNINSDNLQYFSADSAEELKSMISKVRLPLKIVSIYAVGNKHVAWFLTSAKIVKKKKEK